jgi:inosose dehydratase
MEHHSNSSIRVATAPVSWGVMEETDTSVWPAATQVIEEIAAGGYQGTELGPFAYYPTESPSLALLSESTISL